MAEKHVSKASQLREDLMAHPLASEAIAKKYPKVPELRLRADTPVVEIDDATLATDVIEELQRKDTGVVAVRKPGEAAMAIVLPVERYLELAGSELASHSEQVGTLDGRLMPADSAFAASSVEQVNQGDTWTHSDSTLLM